MSPLCFFQCLLYFGIAVMLLSLKILESILLLFLVSGNFYRVGIIFSLTIRKNLPLKWSRLQAFFEEKFFIWD